MKDQSLDLMLTGIALLAEAILLALCTYRVHQRVDPLRPRLIPYSGLMIALTLLLVATAAHAFALFTGVRFSFGGTPGAPPGAPTTQ